VIARHSSNAEVADKFEFLARKDFPGGIVGGIDDNGFGPRPKGLRQFVAIETPLRGRKRTKRGVAPE